MKIIILAGGLGTRLRGVLGNLPKSLAPIGNKPFLDYLLRFIVKQGFKDVIITTGYGSEAIKRYFGNGSVVGLRIDYTCEKELLGTGGAIKLAETMIDSDDFIVMNGDTYLEVDLDEMLRFHKARGALATMALAHKENTSRYGSVRIDKDNKVITFIEKDDEGRSRYINGGMYVFRKEILGCIPANKAFSLEREVLPTLVGKGLYGFPGEGYFIDIGIPEDYEKAKKELPVRGIV
jgi:D-glycero-alpha-D-manno-heptose 1-phosphate guanylyltransferase